MVSVGSAEPGYPQIVSCAVGSLSKNSTLCLKGILLKQIEKKKHTRTHTTLIKNHYSVCKALKTPREEIMLCNHGISQYFMVH